MFIIILNQSHYLSSQPSGATKLKKLFRNMHRILTNQTYKVIYLVSRTEDRRLYMLINAKIIDSRSIFY